MSVRWALVLMFALPAAATATPPAGPLQSIGLNEAVQRALAHSHELKKARHDVAEVVAKRKAAHAQLFPRLSVEGNLFIWNDKVPFEFGLPATTPQTCAPETLACVGELFGAFDVGNVRDQLTASLTVQIAQPLSGLYPLIYGHKAAKIGVKAVKTSVSITRQQIVAAARRSYLQLKQATASVAIAKSAVQQVETQLKTAQAFHKAGLLGKNDVLKVEVGLARAKGAVVQAEAAKQLATAALAIAIGLPADTAIDANETLADPPPPFALSFGKCLARAQAQRPELAAARAAIAAQRAGKEAVKGSLIPQVTAVAAYQRNEGQGFAMPKNALFIGGVLSWDFQWGAKYRAVQQAGHKVSKAQLSLKQARDGIHLDVKKAYLDLITAKKQLQISRVAVKQAREAYRIEKAKYEKASATTSNVLDAQLALSRARFSENNALFAYYIARSALSRAMGDDGQNKQTTAKGETDAQ